MPVNWARVQALFREALDLESNDERQAFLDEACAGDDELRREVEALLEADSRDFSLLDGAAIDAVGLDDLLSQEGQQVGPYRLIREIGRGGMGAVYLAERADGQFEQQVALKLIKRGMDSDQILRRFESERQILARLQHPNIARLLDGGLTDDGRPYFAMEFVDGQPIDAYCDANRLPIDDRLALFVTVCKAVLYAHGQLIVHRDLKPENILIAEDEDGRPQVKLLDFGIAKLLETDQPGLTRTGMAVMTPAYASPEQVRGHAVSTSTDIYSLGVVLYELLTGVRPYEIDSANPAAAAQVIDTTEPARPSTAVSESATADASLSRGTQPASLRRRLSGDLDVICLKTLRKEPERRYDSVGSLMDDVQRHLDGLPVTARADTVGYRVRKFVGRHRAGVGAAAAAFVVIAALVSFYTVQLQQERDRAQQEAETAEQVVSFMQTLFESNEPGQAMGDTLTVVEVMSTGAERLQTELTDQPAVRARLMDVVASVYRKMRRADDAEPLLRTAIADWRSLGQSGEIGLAASLNQMGWAYGQQMKQDSALVAYEEAIEIRRRRLGPDHPDVAELLNNTALIYLQTGDYPRAEELLREALAAEENMEDVDPKGRGGKLFNLAYILHYDGRQEAEATYLESIDNLIEGYGPDHPNAVFARQALSDFYADNGDLEKADSLLQIVLEEGSRIMGKESLDYAFTLSDLGRIRSEQGKTQEAQELHEEAIRLIKRIYDEPHPNVASLIESLGLHYYKAQEYANAVETLSESLVIRREFFDEAHPDVSNNMGNLALALKYLEEYDRAEAMYREVLAMDLELYGEEHREIATSLHNIASIRLALGDTLDGRSLHEDALAMRRRVFEKHHSDLAISLTSLGRLHEAQNDLGTAERYFAEALDVRLALADGDATAARVVSAQENLDRVQQR
ncbi:MAG: serine/threonine-protein kinase [Bacteroidota bacterium]